MSNNFYIMVQQPNGALHWSGPYDSNDDAYEVASRVPNDKKWWIVEMNREPIIFDGLVACNNS